MAPPFGRFLVKPFIQRGFFEKHPLADSHSWDIYLLIERCFADVQVLRGNSASEYVRCGLSGVHRLPSWKKFSGGWKKQ
jgi:hypothetical protein